MSGSNEERTTAADGTIEPEAVDDTVAAEPESPVSEPDPEMEMSAAEALARVTEAAGDPPPEAAVPAAAETEPAAAEAATDEAPVAEAAPTDDAPDAALPADDAVEEATAEPAAEEAPAPAEPETPPAEAAAATESAATDMPIEIEPESPPADAAVEETVSEAAATDAPTEDQPEAPPTEATQAEAPAEGGEGEPAAAETAPVADEAAPKPTDAEPTDAKPTKAAAPPPPDRPELRAVREALESRQPLEGRVIGWNQGGFHLALGELAAFCPRSEMEVGEIQDPESYLDQTFPFRVLRIQGKRQRIVVSRAAHLRKEKSRQRSALRKKLKPGAVIDGTVTSLKEFGAFVDVGGSQGLVHVSEISHRRIEHPSHVLSEGQQVRVKVLKVEQGGRRISLSIRALEPDPWKDLVDQFPRGAVVKGTVEKANQIGAFIELAPGLTGLLPARSMPIPRETTPARAYPPGKEVKVQIVSVDPRRQRISLALEGSGLEGSRADYQEYQRQSRDAGDGDGEGFNALASAFRRLRDDAD